MVRKIVIAVGIAAQPLAAAGNMWFSLNWVLGFREAGWDVWMVESLKSGACVDDQGKPAVSAAESANVKAWESVVIRFSLGGRATLLIDDAAEDLAGVRGFCSEAEIFLNLSGHFKQGVLSFPRACRVYLDADPAFTQIWVESYQCDMNFADHDRYVSVGQRMGGSGALAPTCGIDWLPTFPPVLLKYWPIRERECFERFTTVAHWQGYGDCEWQGHWYRGKQDRFEAMLSLPGRLSIGPAMEIATDVEVHDAELARFREAGWVIADAGRVCESLANYESFITESSAEFSVAKEGYVVSRTAWFSDRSVCYAASGCPLVLDDTGIAELLPAGEGVHFFATANEALAACEFVIKDFVNQQRLVRRTAEEFFSSDIVIKNLLERLGVS